MISLLIRRSFLFQLGLHLSHEKGQEPRHYRYDHIYQDTDRIAPIEEQIPVVRIGPFSHSVDEYIHDIYDAVDKRRYDRQVIIPSGICSIRE